MKHNPRKPKRTSAEKSVAITNFFQRVFFVFVVVVVLAATLYFFVFPSVLNRDMFAKNILIVLNRLDASSKHIYFAHISGNETKNTIISIPSTETITIPGGYGNYPLQSVYQLLLIDKKDPQFIKSVFSELLGIAVDEIIVIDESLDGITENKLSEFFLKNGVKNVASLKLHYLSKNISLINLEKLEDFEKYYQEFATISGDLYQYCSVAVVNATGENGLARQKGDIIENSGALVVRIDDSPQQQERTKIYYGSEPINCSQLANSISGIFSQEPEILPLENLENAQQYRAKVVVVVGK